ncbi:MAG: hypothetical protein GEU86_13380 [Actinophytocola sp.]|nr:hypothetical protein [Actinophytocola sp.]
MYDPHPRDSGPVVVTDGPAGAPAVLVFDPAGVAKREDIPASWHGLLWDRQVLWCRIPAMESPAQVDAALSGRATVPPAIDVVASGPCTELALVFGKQRASSVRSVLLVDPAAPDDRFPTDEAEIADALWEERSRQRMEELESAGVTVRVIAHSTGGDTDRVPPPLPLGHPDVVEAVSAAIAELDAGEQPGSRPH